MCSHSLKIAVALHKPYQVASDPAYVPVHVGASLHPDIDVAPNAIPDNHISDNISRLNNYYSELTALWLLWKDRSLHADYQGLVHYRRYLGSPHASRRLNKDRFQRIATSEEIKNALKSADILLPKKRHYWIETVRSHYSHTLDINQLTILHDVLDDMYPAYVPAFDHHMRQTSTHILNIMVMRRDLLMRWCEFLFPVLQEVTVRLPPSQYDSFAARYPGRLSELLLDVWIATNNLDYTELPLVSTEPVNWWEKGTSFLAAKFLKKKYTQSF